MPTPQNNSVRLSEGGKAHVTSRVRVQFNKLIKKLETERKRLAAWHAALPLMRSRASAELGPLARQFDQRQRELVFLLDAAHQHKSIGKKEREKLSALIFDIVAEMLERLDEQDEELVALFEKHEDDFSGMENDPDLLALRDMFEEMLGDDDGGHDDGDAQPDGRAENDGAAPPPRQASPREARQAEEEQRLSQSVREIFRKLTSTLHPDRELDPAERDRKTALMQRVNVAYANNDLLGLLELQFEVDQLDEASLASLGEDRIKQYNKLLTKQVKEIGRDIEELEHWLAYELNLTVRGRITPQVLERSLTDGIAKMHKSIADVEGDIREFSDIKRLKAFLKTWNDDAQCYFEDDFF